MSVQQQCPSDLPRQVSVEIFGEQVVADVITTTLEADAGGPRDVLTIDVDGSIYRVEAAKCDPIPMTQ